MKKKEETNYMNCIIGEQLSAVQFVQDYLELHFDGHGLTCYIWPEVYYSNQKFKFGEIDYRNKLCEIINKSVKDVIIVEKELLTIEFEDNSRITLSLDVKNPKIIAEIAIFTDEDGNISIFE